MPSESMCEQDQPSGVDAMILLTDLAGMVRRAEGAEECLSDFDVPQELKKKMRNVREQMTEIEEDLEDLWDVDYYTEPSEDQAFEMAADAMRQ